MFFPFVPVNTFLIVEGRRGEPDRAYPIKKSLKSVLFAVVRAFLLLGFLVFASLPLDRLMDGKPLNNAGRIIGLVGLGFLGVVFVSYPLSRPSAARHAYLLKLVKVARQREAGDETPETNEETPDPAHGEERTEEPPWRRGRAGPS
ncbi:MAG: hypothetical protein U0792_23930 [Gemmataceae bacterium]